MAMSQAETEQLTATLMHQMSAAYDEPKVMADAELKALLLAAAAGLADDDQSYAQVVTTLSHGMSEYYVHHHELPASLLAIYRQVQADVQAGKIDDEGLRRQVLATGLVIAPMMFG
ncbi:bacteriocin immunity protein [Lactiplantibacillus daowaiensis]|uniref:Bacteriocin immunity protein n=1 Tax=Lactiplantibacillus daowaiensis TaxID=2559918 RepID=A0ABW1S3U3_9LACO|nr:bacteriocin immunity protein [Lactiplantibacillus daowaiensis]